MSFENPEFIYLMILPLFVLAYFVLRDGASYERYFSPKVLDKILIQGDSLGSRGRNFLFLLAFLCFILALARPVSEPKEIKLKEERKNLVIALDISSSMKADDIYPSRLEFVKNRLSWLFEHMKDTNIGIIAFAKDAFLVSPITSDKKSLDFLLKNLDSDIVSRQGTNMQNALSQIGKMFTKGGVRDVFLISDGGESEDIKKAIDIAKQNELKVSVMVVGTDKGGSIRVDGELLKDKHGDIVITKRNDELVALSKATGGVYIKEFGSGEGVSLLANSLKKTKAKDEKIRAQKEWFMLPLVLGFLCVFIALHGLNKDIFKKFTLFASLLFITPSYGGVFDFVHLKKAKEYVQDKKYQEAINKYNKLEQNPQITYNKANAYYKLGKFDESIKEYEKVKTDDKMLKSKALFNEGNAYNELNKPQKALDVYEKALKLSPDDEDIKKNIKITKKRLKKKQNKQNKNSQNNKKDSKNKDKNQENKQNSKDNKQDNNQNKDGEKKQENQDKNGTKNKENKNSQDGKKNLKNQEQNQSKQQAFNPGDVNKSDDLEGKRWEAYLKKQSPKTKPIMIGKSKEGSSDENNW